MCEVFDGVLINTLIAGSSTSERELAMEHIEYFSKFSNKKDIIILDRGYPSKAFIKNFIDKDIRLQKSFNLEIDACTKSDFYVEMQHERKSFKVRVIKFMLDSGEEEVLITNLARNTFMMNLKIYIFYVGL